MMIDHDRRGSYETCSRDVCMGKKSEEPKEETDETVEIVDAEGKDATTVALRRIRVHGSSSIEDIGLYILFAVCSVGFQKLRMAELTRTCPHSGRLRRCRLELETARLPTAMGLRGPREAVTEWQGRIDVLRSEKRMAVDIVGAGAVLLATAS